MNVADGPRLDEAQPLRRARRVEEALARSDDHGIDLQVQRVDEVVLDQRLCELRAAVDDDVSGVLLLELRDLFDDVAAEDGGGQDGGHAGRGRRTSRPSAPAADGSAMPIPAMIRAQ